MGYYSFEGELMNKSRLILPPESMPWGRSVEEELRASKLAQSNLNTAIGGLNTQLSSVVSTVGFLSSQTLYANAPLDAYSVRTGGLTSSADDVWSFIAYDPDQDCRVPFITSSTGKIAYQISGFLRAANENWAYVQVVLSAEIFKGSVSDPANLVYSGWGDTLIHFGGQEGAMGVTVTGRVNTQQLEPNTEYLLETYRGWRFTYNSAKTGTQYGQAEWQSTAVSVTKIGK